MGKLTDYSDRRPSRTFVLRVLRLVHAVDTRKYGLTVEAAAQLPGYEGLSSWKTSPAVRRRFYRDLELVREARPDIVVVREESNRPPIVILAKYAGNVEP